MNITPAWVSENFTDDPVYAEWALPVIGEGVDVVDFVGKFERADWLVLTMARAGLINVRQLTLLAHACAGTMYVPAISIMSEVARWARRGDRHYGLEVAQFYEREFRLSSLLCAYDLVGLAEFVEKAEQHQTMWISGREVDTLDAVAFEVVDFILDIIDNFEDKARKHRELCRSIISCTQGMDYNAAGRDA